ncbi:hypothetical protein HUJ05_007685 [Dendroctonus ponderosae]|nr:hypothetical protein HUJ05_007685 [Dendroctonus ponderosae]
MMHQVTNYFACAPVPQTGNRSHFAYRHQRVERVVFHGLFHGVHEEHLELFGTYIAHVPIGCSISSSQESIRNLCQPFQDSTQPTLFPDFNDELKELPLLNLSIHSEDFKLDDLFKIKNRIEKINSNLCGMWNVDLNCV